MRTLRVRTQTDEVATQSPNDVQIKELADLAEFYGLGISVATHRTPLAGPLTPWSFKHHWLPTLTGEHRELIREAGYEGFRDAAESRDVPDLLTCEEMRHLQDSATNRKRFLNLWSAKILVDHSDHFLVEVLKTVTGNEETVSRLLGRPSPVFLSWNHLEEAMAEAVRPLPDEPTLLGEKPKHPLWVLACEALDLGSNPWDQALASALLAALAKRWSMVVVPQPKNVVLTELSALCGKSRDEITSLLREWPSVHRLAFGQPVSNRATPRLWGSDPTPISEGFTAYDEVRALHPEAFTDSVPSHHATRKLDGKAGRHYAILRKISAQFGDQVTSPKVTKMYADSRGLRAAKGCSSAEAQMHSVLAALFPEARITFDRPLENTTRMWRWDFRLEEVSPLMLVEVHGPDHFIEMRASTAYARRKRLRRNREVDDAKTDIGISWLVSHGGGTYLVVHHEVLDAVDAHDPTWLAEILSELGPELPRWIYLRPAEGPGSKDWPGLGNGSDGLDPAERQHRRFGLIDTVWVR